MKSNVIPFGAVVLIGLVSVSVSKGVSESDPPVRDNVAPKPKPESENNVEIDDQRRTEFDFSVEGLVQNRKPVSSEVSMFKLTGNEEFGSLPIDSAASADESSYDVLPIADPMRDKRTQFTDFTTVGDEQNFLTQNTDSNWAFEAENAMWDSFDRLELAHSQVMALECRETLCKTEIVHDSDNAQRVFFERVLSLSDQYQGNLVQYRDDSGRLVTTLYRYR